MIAIPLCDQSRHSASKLYWRNLDYIYCLLDCNPRLAKLMRHWLTLTTWGYVVFVVDACLDVFTTLMELEQVSEMAEAEKPMTADRSNRFGSSSYCGSISFRVLYCKRGNSKQICKASKSQWENYEELCLEHLAGALRISGFSLYWQYAYHKNYIYAQEHPSSNSIHISKELLSFCIKQLSPSVQAHGGTWIFEYGLANWLSWLLPERMEEDHFGKQSNNASSIFESDSCVYWIAYSPQRTRDSDQQRLLQMLQVLHDKAQWGRQL